MCGIFSLLKFKKNKTSDVKIAEKIISKLKKLEIRGSDSAGIYVTCDKKETYMKSLGSPENLKSLLPVIPKEFTGVVIGLGHTRWATHGDRNDNNNTQPMMSNKDLDFILTFNGCITNHNELRESLIKKEEEMIESKHPCAESLLVEYKKIESYSKFKNLITDTDTEVLARMFYIYYLINPSQSFEQLTQLIMRKVKGQFAINVVSKHYPKEIITYSNETPLYVGVEDENCILNKINSTSKNKFVYKYEIKRGMEYIEISSETNAMSDNIKNVYKLNNKEVVKCSMMGIEIFSSYSKNKVFVKKQKSISIEKVEEIKDRLLYEINEQTKTLNDMINYRIDKNNNVIFNELDNMDSENKEKLLKAQSFYFVGCGTSYNACKIGSYIFSYMLKKKTNEIIATHSTDKKQIFDKSDVVFFLSQSGETRDTLNVLKEAKKSKALCIIITNKINSSMSESGDASIDVMAGEELSVASTKAYTSQYLTFVLMAIYLQKIYKINDNLNSNLINEIKRIPYLIKQTLQINVDNFVNLISMNSELFITSRGMDIATSEEGALKITEVSYINSRAISLGELKHGTLALINKDINVLVIANEEFWSTINIGINQIITSGCKPLIITTENMKHHFGNKNEYKNLIVVPNTHKYLTSLLYIIPLQRIAHDLAILKNINPDRPRNLAKSITVQ